MGPYRELDRYYGVDNISLVTDPDAMTADALEGPIFSNMSSLGQCLLQSPPCSNARVTSYSSTEHQDLVVYYRFVNNAFGKADGWGAVQWVVAGENGCPSMSEGTHLSGSPTRADAIVLPIFLVVVWANTLFKSP